MIGGGKEGREGREGEGGVEGGGGGASICFSPTDKPIFSAKLGRARPRSSFPLRPCRSPSLSCVVATD